MSIFVMSDIHGCYNEFLCMLNKISFSNSDQLIMAGDYIDRGKQSYEMLKWIEHAPKNVILLRGNHEEEFITYVDLMCHLDKVQNLETDFASKEDTMALYNTVRYVFKCHDILTPCFDVYDTIYNFLSRNMVTLDDLCKWKNRILQMPYYQKLRVGDKVCIVVHAGYIEDLDNVDSDFSTLEQFYLYAREESYQFSGKQNTVIIAGHTPTIAKGTFAYNNGNVLKYYNKEKNCIFYDIDCGCVFRNREPDAKLACLCLDNEKIFYV